MYGACVSFGAPVGLRGLWKESQSKAQAPDVNGFTLGSVTYDGGEIKAVSPGEWTWSVVESEEERTFKISGRDEWSVYLCDEVDGEVVQLDYWERNIYENDVVVHAITSGSVGAITGINVGLIEFENGEYEQVEETQWVLHKHGGGVSTNYTETARDLWSVYLQEDVHKFMYQADYQRKWISYISETKVKTDFHKIIRAEHSDMNYRHHCGQKGA